MSKYHINANGEAGKCRAQAGGCPFGGADEHFSSPEAARDAFEQKQGGSFGKPAEKEKRPIAHVMLKLKAYNGENIGADVYMQYTAEEWKAAASTAADSVKYYRERLAHLNTIDRSSYDHEANGHTNAELEAAREKATEAQWEQAVAVRASMLTRPRKEKGITVPPGMALVPAVYDRDSGKLLSLKKPKSKGLPTGLFRREPKGVDGWALTPAAISCKKNSPALVHDSLDSKVVAQDWDSLKGAVTVWA